MCRFFFCLPQTLNAAYATPTDEALPHSPSPSSLPSLKLSCSSEEAERRPLRGARGKKKLFSAVTFKKGYRLWVNRSLGSPAVANAAARTASSHHTFAALNKKILSDLSIIREKKKAQKRQRWRFPVSDAFATAVCWEAEG